MISLFWLKINVYTFTSLENFIGLFISRYKINLEEIYIVSRKKTLNDISKIREENKKRCVIDYLTDKYGIDPSGIGGIPLLRRSQLKYPINRNDSNPAKFIKHLINLLFLYKDRIVQTHIQEETNLGKQFANTVRLSSSHEPYSIKNLAKILGIPFTTFNRWMIIFEESITQNCALTISESHFFKIKKNVYINLGIKNLNDIYSFSQILYNRFYNKEVPFESSNTKKVHLFNILSDQLKTYPDQNVFSQIKLSKILHISRMTLVNWINEYLTNKIIESNPEYNVYLVDSFVNKIYSEIWYSPYKNPITYEEIESYVNNGRGTLISSKSQFDSQSSVKPTWRKIEIKCEKDHTFSLVIGRMLYKGYWCHRCNEYKCETIMGWFMDRIFEVSFKKQTGECNLKKVFNLPTKYSKSVICDKNSAFKYKVNITMQSFDGYLEFTVKCIDKNCKQIEELVRVAFEYDGIQHDEYIETYHFGDITNFYKQRCRDIAKEEVAKHQDTIVIRLKERDGFNFNTFNTFQEEIIRQFQEKKGIKLLPMPRYYYDSKKNDILTDSSKTIDIPISSNSNQIQNKQSKMSNFFGDVNKALKEKEK